MVLAGSAAGRRCRVMSGSQIFTSRLKGRPLLDGEGLTIGRIRDVVILPGPAKEPPRALGLVVTLQRRRIFVNLGQIAKISVDGPNLHGGSGELDRFTRQTGEILASELTGQRVQDGTIVDVAIRSSEQQRVGWQVSALAVSQGRSLLHRGPEIVPWDRYPELFQPPPLAEQLAELRDLQPADLATAVEGLPSSRRDQIAAALDDQKLADLLEEMPDQDRVRLLASLGLERGADVVEEMQPDDAADLLADLPAEQRERLLTAMESVQADDLRRLLRYEATTAGGPQTPVMSAAQVYVGEPPMVTPTGRYLGSVGFQRLLRRAPSTMVGQCVETSAFVRPELPERELAVRLAAYNLISVAVCDEAGRLVGAVTVDDVLDHLLPADWRRTGG